MDLNLDAHKLAWLRGLYQRGEIGMEEIELFDRLGVVHRMVPGLRHALCGTESPALKFTPHPPFVTCTDCDKIAAEIDVLCTIRKS